MNIDLRSLKHVVALARLTSFTKAAEELCITQSALSRSIQAIERNAGVKLFDRDRAGVHMTFVGRDFVGRATQLLRDAENLNQVLRLSASADVGEVSFGVGPLAAQALLPSVLPEAFKLKPELRTRAVVRDIDALLPALIAEDLELAITGESEAMNAAPLRGEFLGWFPLSLIVRAGHPLLDGAVPQKRYDYPLLSPGPFSSVDRWPSHLRRYLSGPLHIVGEYGVASKITEMTDAIWLSSTFAAMAEIKAGRLRELVPAPKDKTFRIKMMIYSLNRRSLSPGAVLLKDLFKKQLVNLSAFAAL